MTGCATGRDGPPRGRRGLGGPRRGRRGVRRVLPRLPRGLPRLAPRVVAVALGALLLAAAVEGQERDAPEREAPRSGQRAERGQARALVDRFGARVAEALGLDRSERERLVAELHRSRRERTALAQRRREVVQELGRAVRTGGADPERVASLLEELLELRVRQARIEVEEDRRLSEFLTPLQRARLFHLKRRLAERALDARREGAGRRP